MKPIRTVGEFIKVRSTGNKSSLDARIQLWEDGFRSVVPLEDGVDLWANDDIVCAYTVQGRIITVMTKIEYDFRRAEITARIVAAAQKAAAALDKPKKRGRLVLTSEERRLKANAASAKSRAKKVPVK